MHENSDNSDLQNGDVQNGDLQNGDVQNGDAADSVLQSGQSASGGMNATVRNALLVAGFALVMVALGGAYVFWASNRVGNELSDREARAQAAVADFERSQQPETPTPGSASVSADEELSILPLAQPGEVVFINRVPGDDYGRMGIRHLDGSRTLFERRCSRLHVQADTGVCVSENTGLTPGYTTTFFDGNDPEGELKSYASALPSRARISPDGSLSSVTAFASGASYEDISTDTTTIMTVDSIRSRARLRGASQFTVIEHQDDKYEAFDAQYWGLTFANNDDFYITGFFGETPEIMRGSLDDLTVEPTGLEGSCPSLSPDGRILVYKEMRPEGGFDLVALDLVDDKKWTLNETRSPDDQVEWLDNDTILYALHPEGGDTAVQPEFDIWMLDIAPGSEPSLFLPNADSPAAIR